MQTLSTSSVDPFFVPLATRSPEEMAQMINTLDLENARLRRQLRGQRIALENSLRAIKVARKMAQTLNK